MTTGPTARPEPEVERWLKPVPETARTVAVSGQFYLWAGANLAPINWVLGALGIQLGLGLADTIGVLVVGNGIGMLLFGGFVLLGQRSGATGMVLGRAAFGRQGNYLPASLQALTAIGWCAINTWIILDLVMALLGLLGWLDASQRNLLARMVVASVLMAIQVGIAGAGYRAMTTFERWTVPPTLLVLVAMSGVVWLSLGIDWQYAGPAGHVLVGHDRLAALSVVMTAIGIGWGITWFTFAADYSRFVSRTVPAGRLYLVSVLGQFIPVVWLGILGATLATRHGSADPGQLIVANFGMLAIPVLLLVLHGPIATNILNLYTFSVTAQALDIRLDRRWLNGVVGALALTAVVVLIQQDEFAKVLDAWLVALVGWVAAWAGVMLVHYYWLERRQSLPIDWLFAPANDSPLPAVNWAGIGALLVGMLATWLCMYGLLPATQGPVAVAMGGVDLSWLAGGVVSATVYATLGPSAWRRLPLNRSAEPENSCL